MERVVGCPIGSEMLQKPLGELWNGPTILHKERDLGRKTLSVL
jgi:hypothetical protein